MRIVVGSENPAKLEAVSLAFTSFFPEVSFEVQPVTVPSGVSAQPLSDAETLLGATNRAKAARELDPVADFWLGIEGGLQPVTGEPDAYLSYCWVVVLGRKQAGRARSASYELPKAICELIRQGMELGDADDLVFGVSGSKRENGGVGLLTDNRVRRSQFYAEAVKLALIPFVNPDLFPERED
ncbi:MAG TPA: inosine/xanthosine triphosphatase [Anaerolineaceae bacterium]|nr:inosine/xanthosine triphosphatase [Anaerolineaceae bacterium]